MTQPAHALEGSAAPSILDASRAKPRGRAALGGAASTAVHGALVGIALVLARWNPPVVRPPALVTEMVDVELAPPPPPATPEPPTPARAVPVPVAPRVTPRAAPRAPAPPAAAQAGQVLDSAAPVDFGDSWVTGNAASYAGGTTTARGTATQAVRDVRVSDSTEDRSSAARLADGAVWDCPFPAEADEAAIDHAAVTLRVEVAADGTVRSARATASASPGFAREASRCALARRWAPARDRSGQPTASVALVNVRFDR